ncbi:hypothetical protein V8G54_001949 [Vigna mungo]|uniref:Uncharacterized protein n=1 Tax=Vigna mungo TaxID=3915 RepID=A0AAQ3P992_VIGMU
MGVSLSVKDSVKTSTISPAASALSKENPIASFIWLLSRVKARSISSNSSLCASVSVLSGSTRLLLPPACVEPDSFSCSGLFDVGNEGGIHLPLPVIMIKGSVLHL